LNDAQDKEKQRREPIIKTEYDFISDKPIVEDAVLVEVVEKFHKEGKLPRLLIYVRPCNSPECIDPKLSREDIIGIVAHLLGKDHGKLIKR
jgi:hypothetical protein